MPDHQKEAVSVTALSQLLYRLVADNIASIWIRGEISNMRTQKNGTIYFSLKDDKSKINAIMMPYSRASKSVKDLKDGQEILLFGNVSYYQKEGTVSLFVEDIEFLGKGLLQMRFDELKAKLEKEGLFDPRRKRPIPKFPEWVGVVTSPSGAAIQDILNVARRRFQSVNFLVIPATVQGENAPREIARAIRIANLYAVKLLDALIITRGGGSIEDLWCFNDETVAREIAASVIPTISAVGHEIDYTIADYVADYRAPTPSAAAEIVTADKANLSAYLRNLANRMEHSIATRLENYKLKMENRSSAKLKQIVQTALADNRMTLENLRTRFDSGTQLFFDRIRSRIRLNAEKLTALNPKNILSRGYSITYRRDRDAWSNIRSSGETHSGDELKTVLASGEILSVIKKDGL